MYVVSRCGLDSAGSEQNTVSGYCEYGGSDFNKTHIISLSSELPPASQEGLRSLELGN